MKSKIRVSLNLIGITIICVLSFFLWQYYNKYQALSLSLLNPDEEKNRTVFNDEWLEPNQFIVKNTHVYISLSTFEKYIDSDITLSGTGQRIYLKIDNIGHQFDKPLLTQYVDANIKEINVPLLYEAKIAYIDMSIVEKLYPVAHTYFQETNNLIVYEDQKGRFGEIKANTDKYQMANSDLFKQNASESTEPVWIVGEHKNYYHILDGLGYSAYVKKSAVSKVQVESVSAENFITPEVSSLKKPFSMTFEVIDQYSDNFKKQATPFEPGIDVISPTWFNLNIDGIIINSADLAYTEFVKDQDVELWGLFKNNFSPKWTKTLLNSDAYQKKAVAQMLMYAAIYELDGINLDFENIYLEDQDALSRFVKELAQVTGEYNQVISMDVTRPKGSDTWSKVYDRRTLSQFVDYMILMAYDEHWGSSPISGSVASMGWTEDSITMSLEEIPSEKLVLGIPLYMRVWQETPLQNGQYKKVGSRAITLSGFDKMMAERNLELIYDEPSGQYYTEYFESGDRYRIWVEDEHVLNKRLGLSERYSLPGIATWRRGFERNSTFSVISTWQSLIK
ncbi:glycosyl hydrolase family 18 protein [Fusibacter sp. 3D3]|uniref:glycosyl hydrolase family 18 protein n=1 Tax=Fusibacter sp. 3D3 TaxID=1048380 RepID=UPI0008530288|nr:glycosyl hydrolase family 18 protein [Fusibacter sp. 3D3]GAU78035.1 spore peptidoglycan hydrolase [Fusibacter sp. 3D3]